MAVFSPPSALDRSACDVVLSFAWPSSFLAAASFFHSSPRFGRGVGLIVAGHHRSSSLICLNICVDTPCDTRERSTVIVAFAGCMSVAGEENVECGGRRGVDPQSRIVWRNRTLVLGKKCPKGQSIILAALHLPRHETLTSLRTKRIG